MTREDIVRMAKKAGMESFNICIELDDFAKLVAEHEREECAKLCEKQMEDKSWVGLTDEDLQGICDEWQVFYGQWMRVFVGDIESKLKERNT